MDSVKGDGRCVPKPASCQYIVMRPGDKANFDHAPSGKRFNLILSDIHAVEISHKPPAKAPGDVNLEPKLPPGTGLRLPRADGLRCPPAARVGGRGDASLHNRR